MAVSDFLAPTVTAAVISAAMSYVVTKRTATSTIESAVINAAVEREKLAHSREEFRAERRDKALSHLIVLTERMEIVANAEIVTEVREAAAREARPALAAVVITLRDDARESPLVSDLLEALLGQDLKRAAEIWPQVRHGIMSGTLS